MYTFLSMTLQLLGWRCACCHGLIALCPASASLCLPWCPFVPDRYKFGGLFLFFAIGTLTHFAFKLRACPGLLSLPLPSSRHHLGISAQRLKSPSLCRIWNSLLQLDPLLPSSRSSASISAFCKDVISLE